MGKFMMMVLGALMIALVAMLVVALAIHAHDGKVSPPGAERGPSYVSLAQPRSG